MISLFALFTAGWGLHLRLRQAQANWKEEAVMVRRRSMAMLANAKSNAAASSTAVAGSEASDTVPGYKRGSMLKDPEFGYQADTAPTEELDEKAAVREHGVRRVS